jgi:copper transport protein
MGSDALLHHFDRGIPPDEATPDGNNSLYCFNFLTQRAPSATPAVEPQIEADRSLRLAIWLTKIVLYVGLFCGIGGAFYAAWIAIGPLAAQGLDMLGLPLSQLLETHVWMAGLAISYGWTVGIAFAGLVAARIALDMQSKRLLATWG